MVDRGVGLLWDEVGIKELPCQNTGRQAGCQSLPECKVPFGSFVFFGTYEKEYATEIKVVKQFLQISRLKIV